MSSNSASNSAYAASLVAATALAKTLSSPLPPLPPPSSYDGHVYEPSDDTYLMVDAIAHHLSTSSSSPTKVLEIGTGSGCNIVKAAQCLEGKGEVSAKPQPNYIQHIDNSNPLLTHSTHKKVHGDGH